MQDLYSRIWFGPWWTCPRGPCCLPDVSALEPLGGGTACCNKRLKRQRHMSIKVHVLLQKLVRHDRQAPVLLWEFPAWCKKRRRLKRQCYKFISSLFLWNVSTPDLLKAEVEFRKNLVKQIAGTIMWNCRFQRAGIDVVELPLNCWAIRC